MARTKTVRTKYRKKKKFEGYKKMCIFVIGILLLAVLLYISIGNEPEKGTFSASYVNMEEIPDFLQFTYYSKDEWKEQLGWEFTGRLTYQSVSELLEHLKIKDYVTYEEKKPGKEVDRDSWNQIYAQMIELLDTTNKIEKKSILYLSGGEEENQLKLTTPDGIYYYSADVLALEQYQCYDVYVLDQKILGFEQKNEDEVTISNVYIVSQGEELKFIYKNNQYEIPLETTETIEQVVCDIQLKNKVITKIQKKEDYIEGKLLAVRSKKIEIEGYGMVERVEDLPVYQTIGEAEQKSLSDIVIGNMNLKYVVADKEICAILITEPAEIETIRVLLLNDNQGPYRENVYISSESAYEVSCGDMVKEKKKGSVMKASSYLKDNEEESVKVEAVDGGSLYFCNKKGEKLSNTYEGILEIRKYESGYTVVNALSLESYLCGVVPSEMPASYPIEALKAQAICARSYAYIQMIRGDYADLGAHIDDSTNYQVYNKQSREESTGQAVKTTEGQVISNNGETVEAYYYSTSYGHSGSYESWNLENEGTLDYLSGTWLKDEAETLDLSDETVFSEYIQKTDETCYDSFAKYFRWQITLDLSDKSDVIKEKINARKSVQPSSITIHIDKTEVSDTSGLGKFKSFKIKERSSSGGIKKLVVNFENGKVDICDEYSIRIILGCGIGKVTWQDGSESSDLITIPSSYFTVISSENGNYTLCGGGYGHGIGMSQNGAKGMADLGYSYQEILEKFYQGVSLKNIYTEE